MYNEGAELRVTKSPLPLMISAYLDLVSAESGAGSGTSHSLPNPTFQHFSEVMLSILRT